jgi:hypothetical protein
MGIRFSRHKYLLSSIQKYSVLLKSTTKNNTEFIEVKELYGRLPLTGFITKSAMD